MKKYIYIIMCIGWFGFTEIQAQRCLPKQTGIEIKGGFVDGFHAGKSDHTAFYGGLFVSTYTKTRDRWFTGAEYLTKYFPYKNKKYPVTQLTAEGGYLYSFLSDKGRNVFLSAGGSVLAGYETVNWNQKLLSDGATITDRDSFLGGVAGLIELEIFFTDKIVFLVDIKERVLFGGETGNFHTQIGVGFKFILN